jgi:hypothetical protein
MGAVCIQRLKHPQEKLCKGADVRKLLGNLNMQRKVLLPPLVVTFFFVVCALLSYRGLVPRKWL